MTLRGNVRGSLVAFAAAALPGPVSADSVLPPQSYTVRTSDGRFIFVMHAPEIGWTTRDEELREEARRLRELYPKSGLYKTDGSREPVWTVDWYAPQAYPASDGVHLVAGNYGGMISGGIQAPGPNRAQRRVFFRSTAYTFYANGQLVGECRVGDLVDDVSGMKYSVTSINWLESESFDDARMELVVRTKDGNRVALDVYTGRVLRKQTDPLVLLQRWSIPLSLLTLLALAAGVVWRRRQRRSRQAGVS